jgi:hypothetical protein
MRATLTGNPNRTPELLDVTLSRVAGAPNTPPVAVADAATTDEDVNHTFAAGSLTANDTDEEESELQIVSVTQGANGLVTSIPTGRSLRPEQQLQRHRSVTYTVSDGSLNAVGTVTMTVTPSTTRP